MLGEARDPRTASARLAALAEADAPEVQRAVASNPNAPLPALLRLAPRFPDEVVRNPALPLLLLEQPDLWASLPEAAALALAGCASLTPLAGEGLARHPSRPVRLALAGRRSAMPAALLLRDPDERVREAAEQNPGLPPETLRALARHPDERVRRSVALNPGLPDALVLALARDRDAPTRRGAVVTARRSPELLARLALARSGEVRALVAGCAARPETLALLARDKYAQVREAVAWNRHTPAEALLELAGRERSRAVCRALVAHPAMPRRGLLLLAADARRDVKERAARRLAGSTRR